MTSARIALDIRHQPVAERDEGRIVLPERAVNKIPGLPLGHREVEWRDGGLGRDRPVNAEPPAGIPEERPPLSTIEPLTATDDQRRRPGTHEDDGHD
jgi:hypothetical protein